jgi:Ca-activated chloride channel family protein
LCVLGLFWAAPALAQDDDRSVLIILDGSNSMNEDAGDGGTRLDAAKSALDDLIGAVPEGAKVGLRVYGNRVSGVARAEGCKDTNLETPVGPLDRDAFKAKVNALEGKGRTPIGRSLLKAPDDLGPSGERTVILVSDGGDNCAPPPPCQAARQISKRGLELSISVVGLQVNPRVRRQLKCIAAAGGGTYVDASDPEALKRELLAAFARAFRAYEPSGTPVEGAPDEAGAPVLGDGQYLDGIRPGEQKFYAVDVKPGQKVYASAVAIPPRGMDGSGTFKARLTTPRGEEVQNEGDVLDYDFLGQYGNIKVLSTRSEQTAAPGIDSDQPPGRWKLAVALETGDLEAQEVPVELGIQVLDPNEAPGQAKQPGAPGQTPTPSKPEASATPKPPADDEDAGSSVSLPAGGLIGLALGLVGGYFGMRARRS